MTDRATENTQVDEPITADADDNTDAAQLESAMKDALQGTDSGSDTRAGSLRGGSASGSEIDPDQDFINADLARQGREIADTQTRPAGGPEQARASRGQPGDDVDAPTD